VSNYLKRLAQRTKEIVGSNIFRNVLSLQSVEFLKKIVPLLLVPYLARVLGAGGWGLVAFAKSFSAYLVRVIEYGFNLTITRRIARHKDDPGELNQIFTDVISVTSLLVIVVFVIGYSSSFILSEFEGPFLLWATLGYALAKGLHPVWWFLGLEQMRALAVFEGVGKLITLVTMFLLVKGAGDAWIAVSLYALGAAVTTILGFIWAFRRVSLRIPRPPRMLKMVREGFSIFLYQWASILYSVGNSFTLGLFVAPQYVGYFAGAEKISRASWSILTPVGRALFPRLSDLVKSDIKEARRLVRISTGVLVVASVFMGIFMIAAAPSIVSILLGEGYKPAVPVLQILSVVPLLMAIQNVLGEQWMIPHGMDWHFTVIIVIGAITHLLIAISLIPIFSYYGMAYTLICSKTLIVSSILFVLYKRERNPLSW
jgi:PST family polysaccharide transporter